MYFWYMNSLFVPSNASFDDNVEDDEDDDVVEVGETAIPTM